MALVVAFEGLSGSGKSTAVREVLNHLRRRKLQVIVNSIDNVGLLMILKWISYRYHYGHPVRTLLQWTLRIIQSEIIEKKLEKCDVILVDRYFGSTLVYDVYGKGLPHNVLVWIMQLLRVKPNTTIFIDTPAEICLQRKRSRTLSNPRRVKQITDGYAKVSVKHSWVKIDGTLDPKIIVELCLAAIDEYLPSPGHHQKFS